MLAHYFVTGIANPRIKWQSVCTPWRGKNPPRGALEQKNSNNFKTTSHNLDGFRDRWDAQLFDSISRPEEGNLLKWDYVLSPSSYYETFLKWALNISAPFRLMNEILQAGALQGSGSIVQSLRGRGWLNSGSLGGPLAGWRSKLWSTAVCVRKGLESLKSYCAP